MIAKRIIGFSLLAGMGYVGYLKLEDGLSGSGTDMSMVLFLGLILAVLLFFAVRRVLMS